MIDAIRRLRRRWLSGGKRPRAARAVKARYDAAQTTEENRKHWAFADDLSAVSANSQGVRRTLRSRSRYEVANNCYARGMLDTVAAYTVGNGPTLQLTYTGDAEGVEREELEAAAQKVERQWAAWAEARKLTQKLSTVILACDQDGEAFGLFTTARADWRTPVTLNVRLYEADQFDDPTVSFEGDDSGVRVDATGEPTEYAMLNEHPGDLTTLDGLQGAWIPAAQVLHVFRGERAGQLRGIPRTTPALPLFAQMRRFTLATVTAAETAADFAAILYGDQPADPDAAEVVDAWDRIELERGALLTAPEGSRLAQLKAEHPNATYDEFVRAILREIARCMSVPAVVALGDASTYNYASGRLDLQSFTRQIACDRSRLLEWPFLNRLWQEWIDEALLVDGFLPEAFAATAGDWQVSWRWAEPEHVDRAKEAAGQKQELENGTTTLAREYARRGLDWREEVRQRAIEERFRAQVRRELGLPAAPEAGAADNDSGEEESKAGEMEEAEA